MEEVASLLSEARLAPGGRILFLSTCFSKKIDNINSWLIAFRTPEVTHAIRSVAPYPVDLTTYRSASQHVGPTAAQH
ncbi:hypothetical protein SAMN05443244_0550 [Terriglobus roseus]|uniref:Uncharacterized protein n=1 Tax=Terriglobus roseus TaxID=392734 RepID=A0A1H4JDW3_9BACT|nr:hypothetical protein SAMN05443244_0550 [Terriglobus roseus]